jgi:hypothetical protein
MISILPEPLQAHLDADYGGTSANQTSGVVDKKSSAAQIVA